MRKQIYWKYGNIFSSNRSQLIYESIFISMFNVQLIFIKLHIPNIWENMSVSVGVQYLRPCHDFLVEMLSRYPTYVTRIWMTLKSMIERYVFRVQRQKILKDKDWSNPFELFFLADHSLLQLWPEIPVISTYNSPFIQSIKSILFTVESIIHYNPI